MSSTGFYTPLFTGSLEDPSFGVRVEEYEWFEVLLDKWAFNAKLDWVEEDSSYPKVQYAYLYGFEYSDDDLWLDDESDKFTLHNVNYNRDSFWELWRAVASTCQPFSFVHAPSAHGGFVSSARLAFGSGPDYVYRVDCEPGSIEVVEVSLLSGEETVEDDSAWEVETYFSERKWMFEED